MSRNVKENNLDNLYLLSIFIVPFLQFRFLGIFFTIDENGFIVVDIFDCSNIFIEFLSTLCFLSLPIIPIFHFDKREENSEVFVMSKEQEYHCEE